MKHLPQFAFYAAAAVLLVGSLFHRMSPPHDRGRMAVSLALDSGHLDLRAELAGAILAFRL